MLATTAAVARTLGAMHAAGSGAADGGASSPGSGGLLSAWTLRQALAFWACNALLVALDREGVPIVGTVRTLLLVAALSPMGGQAAETAANGVLGPLLRLGAPAAGTARSVVRSALALVSATLRSALGAGTSLAIAHVAEPEAAGATGDDIRAIAMAVRRLRRAKEARDLARPLADTWGAGAAEQVALVAEQLESASELERLAEGHAAHHRHHEAGQDQPPPAGTTAAVAAAVASATQTPSGRIEFASCDWDAPVVPPEAAAASAPSGAAGGGEAGPGRKAAALAASARGDPLEMLRGVLRAATVARRDGASADDDSFASRFQSPMAAGRAAQDALRRRFGDAAQFASPRAGPGDDDGPGAGGRVRASVATFRH